jgi:hypothetical protein
MSGIAIEMAEKRHAFGFLPGRQLPLFAVMTGLLAATSWAENDLTFAREDACWVQPGEAVTVFLNVSNLSESINGVQVVISYNPESLLLSDIVPGDGVGSPWDGAFELFEQTAGEEIMYALAIPAAGTDQDAVVARLEFDGLAGGVVTLELRLAADSLPSFVTKLTGYPHGNPITPNLGDPLDLVVTDAGYGDADGDGDIDFADFEDFAACMTGPLTDELARDDLPGGLCCVFEADGDGDIDLDDFAAFQAAFTGPPD